MEYSATARSKNQIYSQQCGLAQERGPEWKQWETDLQFNAISINVKGIHKTQHALNDQGSISNMVHLVSRKRMRVGIGKVEEK